MNAARALAALLLLAGLPLGRAAAHVASRSYSTWRIDESGATVELRLKMLDLSALESAGVRGATRARGGGPLTAELVAYVGGALSMEGCAPVRGSFDSLAAPPESARLRWRIRCEEAPAALGSRLGEQLPGHTHFLRIQRTPDEVGAREHVLSSSSPALDLREIDRARSPLSTVVEYLGVGVGHILGGLDHLAFLFLLLLLARGARDILVVVTGFTLGHSVTLGLVALGYAVPEANAVEALVGLSIAAAALEVAWVNEGRPDATLPIVFLAGTALVGSMATTIGGLPAAALLGVLAFLACHFRLVQIASEPLRWRASVATLFGLVHGLAFSEALTTTRPAGPDLVPALLGFNLGVEIGQLALVLPLAPLLFRLGHRPRWVALSASAGLSLGAYLFVLRAFAA